MRLATIVNAATRAAVDLKAEMEVIEAVETRGNEAASIENARRGFQSILTRTVGLLGELPKSRGEMQEKVCEAATVANFIEGFHKAVMSELARCEFLDKESNKMTYGRFVSKASNRFLSTLREEMQEDRKAPRLAPTDIDFDEKLMERLAADRFADEQKAAETARRDELLPPLKNSRMTPEYEAIMARLKREGKIL